MLLLNLGIFILCCVVMAKSGTMIVSALSNVAYFLRIREFTLAFVLMAISTSLPDLAVGITSATQGMSSLILGAVIGANIIDMTLIVGIAVILSHGIDLSKREEVLNNVVWLLPIAALPILLFFMGGELSRADGIILLLAFSIYMYMLFREGRHLKDDAIKHDEIKIKIKEKKEAAKISFKGRMQYLYFFMKDWIILAIAVSFLVISANYVVKYARIISVDLNFPEILIGVLILAFGTTLPELVFEISAVIRHRKGLLLGDPMGSIVVNSTLVLGIVAIIHPIKAPFILFLTSALFMLLILFFFTVFVLSEKKLTMKEGIMLLIFYVLFVIIEISLKATPWIS